MGADVEWSVGSTHVRRWETDFFFENGTARGKLRMAEIWAGKHQNGKSVRTTRRDGAGKLKMIATSSVKLHLAYGNLGQKPLKVSVCYTPCKKWAGIFRNEKFGGKTIGT